jgi:hypothetical protein
MFGKICTQGHKSCNSCWGWCAQNLIFSLIWMPIVKVYHGICKKYEGTIEWYHLVHSTIEHQTTWKAFESVMLNRYGTFDNVGSFVKNLKNKSLYFESVYFFMNHCFFPQFHDVVKVMIIHNLATFNTCTWNNCHSFIYYDANIYII